ncbi:MAG: hypothetical protein JKX76_04055 [Colwellia sp.]|nr:hypothetical protein [Colwellia sp.]
MGFLSNILGFRDFSKREEIKRKIASLKIDEDVEAADSLIFFKTSKQQTWLIATNKNLYCVLDDIAKDTFEVRWSLLKRELIGENGSIALKILLNPAYKEKSGRIDFGYKHIGWLYSKHLFSSSSELKERIKILIRNKMYR